MFHKRRSLLVAKRTFAAIRYGYGFPFSQKSSDPSDQLIDALGRTDSIVDVHKIRGLGALTPDYLIWREYRRGMRKDETAFRPKFEEQNKVMRGFMNAALRSTIARAIDAEDGFRERLVRFWADHFTVASRPATRFAVAAYWEDAIRPNVTGRFSDLLQAAVLHPMMLVYLDQVSSIGPTSPVGKKRARGLNENLAREVLELHTLGVGASYTQRDVREFAELLTGLTYRPEDGFRFRGPFAEPGPETVLGKSYGGTNPSLDDVLSALDDIATHPDTAWHIARKLVVHFVSDAPDRQLVDHVAEEFIASQGDLKSVYGALLEHPSAWKNFGAKAKWPFDFLVSALRATGVKGREVQTANLRELRAMVLGPLAAMGQPYQRPSGPDGFSEDISDWISPQGLAARIQWAMHVPRQISKVPDARQFLQDTLEDAASPTLTEAVFRAESRWDAVGLVLASPDFNRR